MCSGDLFVTRPSNQKLIRVHLFFLSMCWIMFPSFFLRMFEPFAVLVSRSRRSVQAQLSPFACEWGPEVTEAMTLAPRPNLCETVLR